MLFMSCVYHAFASVHCCLVVTCLEKADILALVCDVKVKKRAKFRNRYNQAPHLTQDTNGKMTTSQLDITNESLEVSPKLCLSLSHVVSWVRCGT